VAHVLIQSANQYVLSSSDKSITRAIILDPDPEAFLLPIARRGMSAALAHLISTAQVMKTEENLQTIFSSCILNPADLKNAIVEAIGAQAPLTAALLIQFRKVLEPARDTEHKDMDLLVEFVQWLFPAADPEEKDLPKTGFVVACQAWLLGQHQQQWRLGEGGAVDPARTALAAEEVAALRLGVLLAAAADPTTAAKKGKQRFHKGPVFHHGLPSLDLSSSIKNVDARRLGESQEMTTDTDQSRLLPPAIDGAPQAISSLLEMYQHRQHRQDHHCSIQQVTATPQEDGSTSIGAKFYFQKDKSGRMKVVRLRCEQETGGGQTISSPSVIPKSGDNNVNCDDNDQALLVSPIMQDSEMKDDTLLADTNSNENITVSEQSSPVLSSTSMEQLQRHQNILRQKMTSLLIPYRPEVAAGGREGGAAASSPSSPGGEEAAIVRTADKVRKKHQVLLKSTTGKISNVPI